MSDSCIIEDNSHINVCQKGREGELLSSFVMACAIGCGGGSGSVQGCCIGVVWVTVGQEEEDDPQFLVQCVFWWAVDS